MHDANEFPRADTAVEAGGALLGEAGGVRFKDDKGAWSRCGALEQAWSCPQTWPGVQIVFR